MRDLVADLRRVTRKPGSSQSVDSLPSDMQVVVGVVKRNALATAFGVAALAVLVAAGVYWSSHRLCERRLRAAERRARLPNSAAHLDWRCGHARDFARWEIRGLFARGPEPGFGHGLWVRQVSTASNVVVVPPDEETFVSAPTVTPDGAYVDYVRL